MKKFSLVEFSVEHPKLVVFLTIIITLVFMTQFPKIKTDTNPKHMLPETSDVRVWNDEVDRTFGLYEDMIVVGIKNEKGNEKYYVAGDPVARDTFGAEMFKLMAIFAPIAGGVMLFVRYLMFRDLFLSITLMMDAMVSIVWSMGLLIALGFPIHIMSSMAPVFLMAIATDSIHIFNEFYFQRQQMLIIAISSHGLIRLITCL